MDKVRLGISTCLLGERVRFDGGHKRDDFLTDTLSKFVEWVPVCPEFEMGLGAPRERMRLVGDASRPRLIALPSGADHTDALRRFGVDALRRLDSADLDGYVLKKDSPTCGLERVRVYDDKGMPQRKGRGMFAAMLADHAPLLPLEEEGRLHDPPLRESFVERIFAHRRWRELLTKHPAPRDLVEFHTRAKYTLLSHSPEAYRSLGRMVAQAGGRTMSRLLDDYGREYMTALRLRATPRKHVNVLQHLAGMVKKEIDADDRAELAQIIDDYRSGLVPLIVPVTLLRHHLRRHRVAWALEQTYLDPYPAELMLRNHV